MYTFFHCILRHLLLPSFPVWFEFKISIFQTLAIDGQFCTGTRERKGKCFQILYTGELSENWPPPLYKATIRIPDFGEFIVHSRDNILRFEIYEICTRGKSSSKLQILLNSTMDRALCLIKLIVEMRQNARVHSLANSKWK